MPPASKPRRTGRALVAPPPRTVARAPASVQEAAPCEPKAIEKESGQVEILAAAAAGMTPFFVADPSGSLLYANPAYRQLCGDAREPPFPLGELIGEIAMNGGRPVRELSLDHPATARWRVEHVGVYDEGGALIGIAGTFHDAAELIATRQKLAVAQERLDDITRLVSDWLWETDAALILTFVSPRVSEVLGFQPVELVGRGLLELGSFTAEAGEKPFDPHRRTPFRDRLFTMARRDGTQRLFQLSALPIFCPLTGVFQGFRGTARDISVQAEATRRAAQSQSQLTQALESISEGFALFDPADRLVLCNRKFRQCFPHAAETIIPGISFEEFLRRAVAAGDIDVEAGEQEAWIANRLQLRSEKRVAFEIKLTTGRWIKVSDHRTADGSTVGIRTDITDLKTREEALFAAKEAAEIASRSKSEFLANISHELRTPLNAIIGFSEIMREEIFGPLGNAQYREYIGDVLASAHHLLDVINDILDIAKAEAGKLELAEDDVEIAGVVRAAMRLVQERAQRGEIAIRADLPADLPLLHADERKLKQILLNLLTNSVKFTPPGGTIEVAARLAENGDFLMTVRDSGIGIAAEDIATALAPFGQVDSKLNRKYEGTGLGLPLSRAMMLLHGGELTIDSIVGGGTVVTLQLPAARVRRS